MIIAGLCERVEHQPKKIAEQLSALLFFYLLEQLRFLFERRDKRIADAHIMETYLHLAGLLVVHGGAQLVIGHKAVVLHTEGVKHIPVCGPQQGQIHEQRHQRAAEKAGNKDAFYRLGKLYEDGDVLSQDYITARRCYSRAAMMGNDLARARLAEFYKNGIGGMADVEYAKLLEE